MSNIDTICEPVVKLHEWIELESYPISWRSQHGIMDGNETIHECLTCNMKRLTRNAISYVLCIYIKNGRFMPVGFFLADDCENEKCTISIGVATHRTIIETDYWSEKDCHSFTYGIAKKISIKGKAAFKRIDTCILCGCERKLISYDPAISKRYAIKRFLKDGGLYGAHQTPYCLIEK